MCVFVSPPLRVVLAITTMSLDSTCQCYSRAFLSVVEGFPTCYSVWRSGRIVVPHKLMISSIQEPRVGPPLRTACPNKGGLLELDEELSRRFGGFHLKLEKLSRFLLNCICQNVVLDERSFEFTPRGRLCEFRFDDIESATCSRHVYLTNHNSV